MKRLAVGAVMLAALLAVVGQTTATPAPRAAVSPKIPPHISSDALNDVVKRYCQRCHNDQQRRGNLTLAPFDVAAAPRSADVAERVIAKLRSGMMPPPGSTKPST
jgi:hypothetical protein